MAATTTPPAPTTPTYAQPGSYPTYRPKTGYPQPSAYSTNYPQPGYYAQQSSYPPPTQRYPYQPGFYPGATTPLRPVYPQPKKKGNPLIGLIGMLAIIIVPVFLYALFTLAAEPTPSYPYPTANPTWPNPNPTGPTAEPSQGGPTTEPPAGDYQNADYPVPEPMKNAPDFPIPDENEYTQYMQDNVLYSQTLAVPVECNSAPIDMSSVSNGELEAHLNDMTACLYRVWGPEIEAAGFIPIRPSVTVYSGTVQTACGQIESMNAAFCNADQQIYFADDLSDMIPSQLQSRRWGLDSVLAHEYGHAIQNRTGIFAAEALTELDANENEGLELSRRFELQADCFSGQFFQSIGYSIQLTSDDQQVLAQIFYTIGDDILSGNPGVVGNHGHGENRAEWFVTGLNGAEIGSCNTFVADDAQVE
jgi:predicted metalloprotease